MSRRVTEKNSFGPAIEPGRTHRRVFIRRSTCLALTLILSLVLTDAPSHSDAQFNAVFYIVNFLVMAAIFHRF